ncbi:MAG: glycosyltransferase family 2 protein [Candidatus Omnitrophota bacterium]|nr:glycosyltransferase family 2 protein [Candidatus Omnitrophota bacterium]MBU1894899.1 glycosyltransferase family 2 protein [Candidatus Omnitrophota bacterium]
MQITIVIPIYNSESTIGKLVPNLIENLKEVSLQIVLVNDGSSDKSHEACLSLREAYSSIVEYINLARNFGEHNAVMAGLNYAKGDYVVIMDDDFQNPPREVPRLVAEAKDKGYDIVYTCYEKKCHSWFRNFGSKFNEKIANLMLDKPKDLYLSSFKCLSAFVVREIIKYKGPFPYIDGLALRCTRNIGIIKAQHQKREDGKSNYTLKKLVNLWLNMFVNFSIIPLRISVFLGLILGGMGILISIYVIIEKILYPGVPVGWTSLMLAVMVFSGVQLLTLGLLGEYVGRLLLSNNQTPQFVVREIYAGETNE